MHRVLPDGTRLNVFTSEHRENTTKPDWNPAKLPLNSINNNSVEDGLVISVWDYNDKSEHTYIGEFKVPTPLDPNTLKGHQFPIINPKKVGNRSYKDSGTFIFNEFEITREVRRKIRIIFIFLLFICIVSSIEKVFI